MKPIEEVFEEQELLLKPDAIIKVKYNDSVVSTLNKKVRNGLFVSLNDLSISRRLKMNEEFTNHFKSFRMHHESMKGYIFHLTRSEYNLIIHTNSRFFTREYILLAKHYFPEYDFELEYL